MFPVHHLNAICYQYVYIVEESSNIKICGVLNSDLICSLVFSTLTFTLNEKGAHENYYYFSYYELRWSSLSFLGEIRTNSRFQMYVCCVPKLFFFFSPIFSPSFSIITHYFYPHRRRSVRRAAESIEPSSGSYTKSDVNFANVTSRSAEKECFALCAPIKIIKEIFFTLISGITESITTSSWEEKIFTVSRIQENKSCFYMGRRERTKENCFRILKKNSSLLCSWMLCVGWSQTPVMYFDT